MLYDANFCQEQLLQKKTKTTIKNNNKKDNGYRSTATIEYWSFCNENSQSYHLDVYLTCLWVPLKGPACLSQLWPREKAARRSAKQLSASICSLFFFTTHRSHSNNNYYYYFCFSFYCGDNSTLCFCIAFNTAGQNFEGRCVSAAGASARTTQRFLPLRFADWPSFFFFLLHFFTFELKFRFASPSFNAD